MPYLTDALLTTEPVQRLRLSQALLAMGLMAAGVVAMNYFAFIGEAPPGAVVLWSIVSLAGMVVAYALIRSGWSRRLHDPSLTVPQMLYAIASGAAAYALVGAGRGGVFPIVMVVLMFGMFSATPRQMRSVSLYAVVLFGLTMLVMAALRPEVYAWRIELGHFIMVATMMPAVSILAARLSTMRERMRVQRVELRQALARIEEIATRDPLTGLVNRRHMEELLERERQRAVRSGHVFCIAMADIDGLKAYNERHGRAAGDELLRRFSRIALQSVRVSDRIGRFGGGTFLLMLSDARVGLARGGVDRLRESLATLELPHADGGADRMTVSIGLTEHRAGENTQGAIERTQAALHEAKQQGRDRIVVH